jgi:hypothetical protein
MVDKFISLKHARMKCSFNQRVHSVRALKALKFVGKWVFRQENFAIGYII